jgi:hypothetical protein
LGSRSSIECPPTIATPAAAEDVAQRFVAQLLERVGDEVQSRDRPAAHGVHVGQRVRGGDPPEVVRVVDDRGEEVDRADDRKRLGDLVDGGIVRGLVADEQSGIVRAR